MLNHRFHMTLYGAAGRPLLLISRLAQHTHNLQADGRCSLLVGERHAEDVQAAGRLTLLADAGQLVDPAAIGHPRGSEIVLGKLSGRAGFVARVAALGIDLPSDGLDRAFGRFQKIANGKPVVNDDDLRAIRTALSKGAKRPRSEAQASEGGLLQSKGAKRPRSEAEPSEGALRSAGGRGPGGPGSARRPGRPRSRAT